LPWIFLGAFLAIGIAIGLAFGLRGGDTEEEATVAPNVAKKPPPVEPKQPAPVESKPPVEPKPVVAPEPFKDNGTGSAKTAPQDGSEIDMSVQDMSDGSKQPPVPKKAPQNPPNHKKQPDKKETGLMQPGSGGAEVKKPADVKKPDKKPPDKKPPDKRPPDKKDNGLMAPGGTDVKKTATPPCPIEDRLPSGGCPSKK
jgi:hypothetical protein